LLRQAAHMPKPYWVNLLYQHAWKLPLKLERPLELYSAEEVERLASQRISVDMGWSMSHDERKRFSTIWLSTGAGCSLSPIRGQSLISTLKMRG